MTPTIRCAWCPPSAPPLKVGDPGAPVSHGICAVHAAAMDAELDTLMPPVVA